MNCRTWKVPAEGEGIKEKASRNSPSRSKISSGIIVPVFKIMNLRCFKICIKDPTDPGWSKLPIKRLWVDQYNIHAVLSGSLPRINKQFLYSSFMDKNEFYISKGRNIFSQKVYISTSLVPILQYPKKT